MHPHCTGTHPLHMEVCYFSFTVTAHAKKAGSHVVIRASDSLFLFYTVLTPRSAPLSVLSFPATACFCCVSFLSSFPASLTTAFASVLVPRSSALPSFLSAICSSLPSFTPFSPGYKSSADTEVHDSAYLSDLPYTFGTLHFLCLSGN